MTDAEREELARFNAYWPGTTESMPQAQYLRWCDLQVMALRDAAQGIEAQRAETVKQGSVHESPVAESDAPNPSNHRRSDEDQGQ